QLCGAGLHELPAHAGLRDPVAVQHALHGALIVPRAQPGDDAFAHRALPPPIVLQPCVAVQLHLLAFAGAHPRPRHRHFLSRKHHVTRLLPPTHSAGFLRRLITRSHAPCHFVFDHRPDDFQSGYPRQALDLRLQFLPHLHQRQRHTHRQLFSSQHLKLLRGLPSTCLVSLSHSGSPLKKEFSSRTLSESGPRAATLLVQVSTKGGTISRRRPSARFSIGPRAASETRTDARSADSPQSPPAPAPPAGQTRSACPSLPPPARCARLAPHRAPANSAAPSRRFHHAHQHPHLLSITASPHHQAPPVPQPYLDPRVIGPVRLWRTVHHLGPVRGQPAVAGQLHFHEPACAATLRRFSAIARARWPSLRPQPLLPPVKVRHAQPALPAERRHTLRAPPLLGNQPPPLRPRSPAPFSPCHCASLPAIRHSAPLHLAHTRCPSPIAHLSPCGMSSRLRATRWWPSAALDRHPASGSKEERPAEGSGRPFVQSIPAATYVPTQLPAQYHRPNEA